MAYEYYKGSVFECAEKNSVDMIVNTVNCKGFMGAGIALEFKLRYPKMFIEYELKCENNQIQVGKLDSYYDSDIKILNFPTKNDWKQPSNIKWIIDGLVNFSQLYRDYGIKSIAFPKLGTSNGGLNWSDVKQVMEYYFEMINDLKIYICLDEIPPEGIEGKMLEVLYSLKPSDFKNIGLRSAAIDNIEEALPVKRFFLLTKIKGLGMQSYEKLHSYCYQKAISKMANSIIKEENEQLNLFD
ncbi:macro domain-containing protein [Neobacillus sp. 114]|uniref:macro domain-containing protein n=1 Tax=Neobacillus sp. 114 TaxID=3048535 RepID=UPI0024C292E6|nr:macro domain-containing protein [Neobacillus sp. 114]